MVIFDQKREIELRQLLPIIRLALLFICVIAFSQYFFKSKAIMDLLSLGSGKIFGMAMVIVLIYAIFMISIKIDIKDQPDMVKYGALVFWGLLSFLTIFYTGAIDSNFKPLILCVILLATIGQGLTVGMITALTLSLGLLVMDLLLVPNQGINLYFEDDLILSSIFLLITFTVGYYAKLENEHIQELRDLVNIDALTGLFNHRYFYASLSKQMKEAQANDTPVSLIFLDIDDFRIYNELYGHSSGDDVIKRIAQILKTNLETEFVACRYGGEEFAVLMYNIKEQAAMEVARDLCGKIADEPFYGQEYMPTENLTVSAGVSQYPNKAKNAKELVAQADEALYRAKFFKKNRVESYTSILDNLRSSLSEQDEIIITTLKTLISVINSRDKFTYEHVEHVAEYAGWMADELDFSKELRETLIYGGYLHDIGKINTPKEVLLKPDKLTDQEWNELKRHPIEGVEVIEHIESMKDVQSLILEHHERYDGHGYPYGLKGHEISYLARILSVIDAFDAMTSMRPYQKKRTVEEACKELLRCKGTQFDPNVVDIFIGILIIKFNIDRRALTEN